MLNNKLKAHGGLTPAASAPPQNAILAEQLTQYYPISEGELLGKGTVPSVSLPVLFFHI